MSGFRSPWARLTPMRRREARAGLLFVLPWVISLLVFTAYPVLASVILSFTDYNIVQTPHWVGLQNYQTMFTGDPSFWPAVRNSIYYALISVPLGLVVSLALALVLNMRATGISIYRTLFYLPSVVPPIAGTIVFIVMFEPQAGLVNTLIRLTGLVQTRPGHPEPVGNRRDNADFPGWSAGYPQKPVGGGIHRRCRAVAEATAHHPATPQSGDPLQPGDECHLCLPGLRSTFGDRRHNWSASRVHADVHGPYLP
jgi:hypothetical protein